MSCFLSAGIGAQERALRNLKIAYEVIATCDCDKDAVLSYATMRCDFDKELAEYNFPEKQIMIDELQAKNIGYNFKDKKHTITNRTMLKKVQQYYLADKLSKNLGDISKVEKLPYADLVTYSFPCTTVSVSGKGEGIVNKCDCGYSWPIDFSNSDKALICPKCGTTAASSTQSGLLGQVQRLLAEAHKDKTLPKYLLLENVKNLVGQKFKPQFDTWIKWLDAIGYNTYYQVLNAKSYSMPQNRERVFAVSIRKDIDDKKFQFPKTIPLKTRLKDILEQNVDEKYYLPDDRINKILNAKIITSQEDAKDEIRVVGNYMPSGHDASRVVDVEGIAPTVKENHGTVTAIAEPQIIQKFGDRGTSQYSVRDYAHTIPANPMSDRGQMVVEPQIIKVGQVSSDGSQAGMVYSPDGLSPTICAGCHGYAMGNILEKYEPQVLRAERTEYGKAIRKQYEAGEIDEKIGNMREMKPRTDGIANTITTLLKDNYVAEPTIEKAAKEPIKLRIRKLTTKECWRLMGFTDKDHDKAMKYVSDSALYKQAGNSIVTNCLTAIFYSLFFKDNSDKYKQYLINFND